jgi:crotonobetaine/carnitine-CoA ligase
VAEAGAASYEVPPGESLASLLRRRYAAQPSARAVHIEGVWLSYDELQRLVFRYAAALRAAGVRAGVRVATLLPNNRAFLGIWLACNELGAVLVPININLSGDTLRYIVEHAEPHVLAVEHSVFAAYTGAFGEATPAGTLVTAGGDLHGATRIETLLEAASESAPPLRSPEREQPALIIYTSGTTGRPKGVVLSRAAQLAHGWYYGKDFVRLAPGECSYTCLPLFHVTSMGFSLGTLLGGAAVAIDGGFSPFGFWSRVRQFKAKIFPFLGAMVGMLSARPEQPDDATVPAVRAVGAATPLHLWEQFERRFGLELIETYGQTETASLWLMPPPGGARVGTVGKPAPRLRTFIAGEDGRPAAPGTVGEIVQRPHDPLLMTQGYFRDGAATSRAFHDGWYWTGDAGSMDAEGYLRFAGRLKDFIRRRGENVSAFEVERVALTHPAVKEAAAVGVPAEVGEEEIKLCLLLLDGQDLEPFEMFRHLRARLSGFMVPRYVEVYADFPRTATQRVQKFRLVEDGVRSTTWDRHHRGS